MSKHFLEEKKIIPSKRFSENELNRYVPILSTLSICSYYNISKHYSFPECSTLNFISI